MSGAYFSNKPVWRDPWVVAALVAALGLRLVMAHGGLWLDEAWSAVQAHDVKTPLGVIVGINHDNNHPLNSWWSQLVGIDAPPLLARLLSIVCSVAAVIPAAAFAARREAIAGRAAAWLFALSPMLAMLGSEARGYAPALLALVILVDRLDPRRVGPPPSPTTRALIGLFGTLGHLLMLPAIGLLGLWLWVARRSRRAAAAATAPAFIASLGVVATLFGAAWIAKGGMTVGNTTAFGWLGFAEALVELVQLTLGAAPLLLGLILATVIGPRPDRADLALCLALALGLPLVAVLAQLPNTQISRYFMMSSLALLWLTALRVGALWRSGPRVLAALLLAATLIFMAVTDSRLIDARRGDPDEPVRRIAADHPGPARVLIAADPLSALITVAAVERGVPVTAVGPACVPADYLVAGLYEGTGRPVATHCGRRWLLVDHRPPPFGSGGGWLLYRPDPASASAPDRRAGLPAPGPVASGPRPAL